MKEEIGHRIEYSGRSVVAMKTGDLFEIARHDLPPVAGEVLTCDKERFTVLAVTGDFIKWAIQTRKTEF